MSSAAVYSAATPRNVIQQQRTEVAMECRLGSLQLFIGFRPRLFELWDKSSESTPIGRGIAFESQFERHLNSRLSRHNAGRGAACLLHRGRGAATGEEPLMARACLVGGEVQDGSAGAWCGFVSQWRSSSARGRGVAG
jgi:hypothetical protein